MVKVEGLSLPVTSSDCGMGGPDRGEGGKEAAHGVWACDSPSPRQSPSATGTLWPAITCVSCGDCGGSAQNGNSVHLGAGPRPVECDQGGTRCPRDISEEAGGSLGVGQYLAPRLLAGLRPVQGQLGTTALRALG